MSESTRRLAMACRLQRPVSASSGEESKEELEYQEQIREREVEQRRRAVGEDMASLLTVMSEVRLKQTNYGKQNQIHSLFFQFNFMGIYYVYTKYNLNGRCSMRLLMPKFRCANHLRLHSLLH